ncbi:casein kinase I-like [Paramacrobiotus metropolitanus]|uniref:casein kinase I-like n=1 Tax=Paramacrobiotus metropolitanus TaxID=2943436 RepID=UPI00244650F1|nr:casein kinase I-like [Paramacrobiotus metropolitanus]XP_055330961.1 casein kinase I-like [Paramacrobiotus metropolitanus]XP_055330962.1 casein kinase I-like [Paramacrobiotus metropolitanus]XP_055330963.1 casein kinase I-like [Paramacrobiotus metropolitanus]
MALPAADSPTMLLSPSAPLPCSRVTGRSACQVHGPPLGGCTQSVASDENTKDDLLGAFIGHMYLIGHIIGKGSFGTIRLCNSGRPKHFVVAKIEQRRPGRKCRLADEFNILQEIRGAGGFPKVHYYCEVDASNVIVLDMLGPTLDDLLTRVGGTFSKKTMALIGLQLMDRLEFLHSRNILYRDVKGENLLIGLYDHHNRIHIVDFGLCRHAFKEDGQGYTPVGTPRYMSLATHAGRASTYRDDVESVGYLLVYFVLGRLPWQGMPAASTDTKIAMIANKKMNTSLKELCNGIAPQMREYLQAARQLEFNQFPDYGYFRGLLKTILKTSVNDNERFFDWQKPGIKLTVSPKHTYPTALSVKHDVDEQNVVDLRVPTREISAANSFETRFKKVLRTKAVGKLSNPEVNKELHTPDSLQRRKNTIGQNVRQSGRETRTTRS